MNITCGLDLPLAGAPSAELTDGPATRQVAVLGPDYHDLKPTMLVEVGDAVRLGDPLFEDKKNPGVIHTAPGSGTVKAIHRGERRSFLSCVIEIEAAADAQDASRQIYEPYPEDNLVASEHSDFVKDRVVKSGLWPALRTRPFSKTPSLQASPQGVFVSTIDTHPLALDPAGVIGEHEAAFAVGLKALYGLTHKPIYLNTAVNQHIPGHDFSFVTHTTWSGKHPAGLVGTHMHYLLPVSLDHVNWHIGYQDLIALGYLFLEGRIWTTRYVALGGPMAAQPRMIKTRLGACLDLIIEGEMKVPSEEASTVRVISGSVLGGRRAAPPVHFLSRWSNQISLLAEGTQRDFFLTKGWLSPGFHKFSLLGTYFGKFVPGYLFPMNTSTQGSKRSMVPIGLYEKVMPLDIIPTYLLRALISQDTERAQALGALELDEEDLALCTFVCPGKYEYGPILRENLRNIETNG